MFICTSHVIVCKVNAELSLFYTSLTDPVGNHVKYLSNWEPFGCLS